MTARYPEGMEPDKEGTIMFAEFSLLNTWFAGMDSAREHTFTFNEAISLVIPCQTQDEIDYYWEQLSADPNAEACGWLKDQFGLSWQVWPTAIGEMMTNGTREQIDRLTQAFLPMKKFDIATLQKAYEGK
jgi:predicted 3-demethylubiquinone-9 3-methyltransferase (glyoxalase superfamily)